MFVDYYKIMRIKKRLTSLRKLADIYEEARAVDKQIWRCQKKGFLSHLDLEAAKQALIAYSTLTKALKAKGAYFIHVASKVEGKLQLVSFTGNTFSLHDISLKDALGFYTIGNAQYESIERVLLDYCPSMLPLSQLEEIALWLTSHGNGGALFAPLSSHIVEEKLATLMRECPSGAYVLYPNETGGLVLSRLLKQGQICHFSINLTKNPGCYTFDIAGTPYSAGRSEFKRKLEMMGTPLRIQVANGK
jgi:hypothetical protein